MLETISFSQRQRLAYIDFCLLFKGAIHRQDLINRFEVGLSAGSRDFTLYKELAPENLIYDPREKRYFQTENFVPVFEHDAKRTLIKLANDISDGFDAIGDVYVTLVMLAGTSGLSIEECVEHAWNQIKDRKGYLRSDGIFVKEE